MPQEPTPASSHTQSSHSNRVVGWTCGTCGLKLSAATRACPQDGTKIEDSATQIDASLAQRYEFIEAVGSGGMSVIFKARSKATREIVAIKMLQSHLLDDLAVDRFEQEAKAAAKMRHPNVIGVRDFGVTEHGQPYMVMDFIDGLTLADLIEFRKTIPLPEALDIFQQVCDALDHAHDSGVLHRDLKPSNVMLVGEEGDYHARLVDFGVAKIIDSGDTVAKQLTRTGEVVGSPMYMSPEQCLGKPLDARSDIYSLGCILYEMLTGTPPHVGESAVETMFKHLNDTPVSLQEACPNVVIPDAVEEFVMKLLAPKRKDRYQDMSQVKAKLRSIQAGALGRKDKVDRGLQLREFLAKLDRPTLATASGALLAVIGLGCLLSSKVTFDQAEAMKHSATMSRRAPDPTGERERALENERAALIKQRIKLQRPEDYTDRDIDEWVVHTNPASLDLNHSQITDMSIPSIVAIKGLQSLNLHGTKISRIGLRQLANAPTLRELSLESTKSSPSDLSLVADIKTLTTLNLERTNTDDSTLEAIAKLPRLHRLILRDCPITDKGIKFLSQCHNLTELDLTGTNVGDEGLQALSSLRFSELKLSDTRVTGRGLQSLSAMNTLSSLTLRHLKIADSDLAFLPTGCIDGLDLSSTSIGDEGAKQLVRLKTVSSLNLQATNITDAAVSAINALKDISYLDVDGTKISDKFLYELNLPELQALDFGMCHVSDAGIKSLVRMKTLRNINATRTLISDAAISALETLPLNEVTLYDCPKITHSTVMRLRGKIGKTNVKIWTDY